MTWQKGVERDNCSTRPAARLNESRKETEATVGGITLGERILFSSGCVGREVHTGHNTKKSITYTFCEQTTGLTYAMITNGNEFSAYLINFQ